MSGSSNVYGGSGPAGEVGFNYTPLIDVTFNLIIFFVLTSQISTASMSRVLLPTPNYSTAQDPQKVPANRIVVNVVSAGAENKEATAEVAASAKAYEVNGKSVPVLEAGLLTTEIKRAAKEAMLNQTADKRHIDLEIRADFRVRYADIDPVLIAATKAEVPDMTMTITALMDLENH
jgi:biopolymer transport protein ExbD